MVFGYLDAGTGSLLLQAILGGIAGVAVFFRARFGWGKKKAQKQDSGELRTEADAEVSE